VNRDYICNQAKRLRFANTQAQQDILLYYIGNQANLINFEDVNQMRGGQLTPKMRSQVLTWLRRNANDIGLTMEG
jgi:hypothetical protein